MSVKPTEKVEFVGNRKRGSIYEGVFQAMSELPLGKSLLLPLNGLEGETARNRINAAVRRAGPKAPRGHRWSMRLTSNDQIAITAVKITKSKK